jgi:REP element-mobilizing transposase RayT
MAKDAHHEVFIHTVWHTARSTKLILRDMEQELYDFIRRRALQPGGVYVHEIGGTENHVHLVTRIPPTVQIAEWIGRVKGGSAHDINHTERWAKSIEWQSGYGVVSFGAKDLAWVCAYVKNQKEHHYKGTIFERLEGFSTDDGAG